MTLKNNTLIALEEMCCHAIQTQDVDYFQLEFWKSGYFYKVNNNISEYFSCFQFMLHIFVPSLFCEKYEFGYTVMLLFHL